MRPGLLVLLPLVLAACPAPGTCEGGETDCADTDAVDTDETDLPDTDLPPAKAAPLRFEWDVDVLPNDNVVTIKCDDRQMLEETFFTFFTTIVRELEAEVGSVCTVTFEDYRGGRLLPGRAFNCSKEVASWEGQRGLSAQVASFTVFSCIPGCPDPVAENYDPVANLDNDTCEYIYGCTRVDALNYDPGATKDDGSCDFGGFGSVDLTLFLDDQPADTTASVVCDGSGALAVTGVGKAAWSTLTARTLVDAGHVCEVRVKDAVGDRGPGGQVRVCGEVVESWTAPDPQPQAYETVVATFTSAACSGCTDPAATNFDVDADVDDGTCTY